MFQRGSRVTSAPFSWPEGGGHLYPVSNGFLNAVKANTRKYYWTGRKVELFYHGNTPVLTVERKYRFTSSFSGFIKRYTAVSSTNLRTQIAEYYALDPDDGLIMNLSVNPLLQYDALICMTTGTDGKPTFRMEFPDRKGAKRK